MHARMTRPWCHVALLACLSIPMSGAPARGAQPVAIPDTPAGRRCAELFRHIASDDEARMTEYARAAFSPSMFKPTLESMVEFLMMQSKVNRGYSPRRVLQSSDTQVTLLVQSVADSSRWLRFVVNVEPDPPHLVQGFFLFQAAAASGDIPEGPIAERDLPKRLGTILDRMGAEGGFSGAVELAKDGKVLLRKAWGEADREAHVQMTPETRFDLASVSKMFTAVAIAQLVERGKLKYSDRIAQYVPDWLSPESRAITIDQLLTHTSGLGDYLTPVMEDRSGHSYRNLSDYEEIARHDVPVFPPGTGFQYSNTGYLLLGAVIEKITGEPYDVWVRKNVFEPAGMAHSSSYRPDPPRQGFAVGYYEEEDQTWARNDSVLAGRGTSAGGGCSTVDDMIAFARALTNGVLVRPETLAGMIEPRVDMAGTGLMYGRGFVVAKDASGGAEIYGHTGGFPGIGTLFEVYRSGNYVLVALSNTTDGGRGVGDEWRDLLRHRER
jgi:CubicO group peptidase (beta-lactamase class C family)